MRHRAIRAGTVLLTAGALAAAVAAPALATGHPRAKAKPKGTTISTRGTSLGTVLASSKGRVMYLYAKDGRGVSHCTGGCLAVWPAVTTPVKPIAAKGVLGKHLAVTKKHQVTYYGHPLYYFASDKVGTVRGENVGSFFAVSIKGVAVKPKKKPTAPSGPTTPAVVGTETAGGAEVVTSSNGHTLYDFSLDSPPSFSCTGGCVSTWPPLLTKGTPTATGDAQAGELGTVKRPDGTTQVTYGGYPLYDYAGDAKSGDANGQGIGHYWYDVSPDGTLNTAPAS